MITSSYALGCNTAYIYIRGEYFYVSRILENAIAEAYAAGYLGSNILGTGYNLNLYVQVGGGAYICGEETALLESLEANEVTHVLNHRFRQLQDCMGALPLLIMLKRLLQWCPS
jgi:NADH:ubiquinone oxidoreductase subunit F (NADH-binding)